MLNLYTMPTQIDRFYRQCAVLEDSMHVIHDAHAWKSIRSDGIIRNELQYELTYLHALDQRLH